ncbi:unnamed protein product [Urochloa humidicola]
MGGGEETPGGASCRRFTGDMEEGSKVFNNFEVLVHHLATASPGLVKFSKICHTRMRSSRHPMNFLNERIHQVYALTCPM